MVQRKMELLDGNLTIGRKYRIKKSKREKGDTGDFVGILIDKTDEFYVFKSRWVECFLKVDFAIGEYKIEEVK